MYHWQNAPQTVRAQVGRVVTALRAILGDDLVGVYLHGSLAMGCFNPTGSDIDLLAVTQSPPAEAAHRELALRLLDLSGSPSPLEISVLREVDLLPWRFPTPFQFHFSEDWRERFNLALGGGSLPIQPGEDADLAAHITILHQRGVVLLGPAVGQIFPNVPATDYLAAIWEHDTRSVRHWVADRPVYGVLNLCRVLTYLTDERITSKEEGGAWALSAPSVPVTLRPVVTHALALYRGEERVAAFDSGELFRFVAVMEEAIRSRLHRVTHPQ